MPTNNLDELRHLSVPAHDIPRKAGKAPKGGCSSRRPLLEPIEVTDYQAVVRQIERKEKRREGRAALLAEMKQEEAARKAHRFKMWVMLLLGIVLALVAAALSYSPPCQHAADLLVEQLRAYLGLL
ncbi:hypothetical protein DQ04_02921060 [Trypanosoma grayi]|uniref:hypothetical protein n=1 Tax=Trypanosoma grayi TaxID=71804 RepID=UPI0004F47CFF|nr:hypothetical protein DQ04_02921060 [Trypanosoma grayi]KEG11159.1 hypothetical protein DQ04_02921060 [Trypanosoma grayi]